MHRPKKKKRFLHILLAWYLCALKRIVKPTSEQWRFPLNFETLVSFSALSLSPLCPLTQRPPLSLSGSFRFKKQKRAEDDKTKDWLKSQFPASYKPQCKREREHQGDVFPHLHHKDRIFLIPFSLILGLFFCVWWLGGWKTRAEDHAPGSMKSSVRCRLCLLLEPSD